VGRIARVVAPGIPYHVTHRGNRRQPVFFDSCDRRLYKDWLAFYGRRFGLEVWAYCLMTNHVHLIAISRNDSSLARSIGCTHGRFARYQNRLYGWSGHLWENRFYSTPLDNRHLWAAVRYVEMNPVRAGVVNRPVEFKWSSATAHIFGRGDPLLSPSRPFPGPITDWSRWLRTDHDRRQIQVLRRNTRTGLPTGSDLFVSELENRLGRSLKPDKRGRRPRKSDS
jgi:putative transposase